MMETAGDVDQVAFVGYGAIYHPRDHYTSTSVKLHGLLHGAMHTVDLVCKYEDYNKDIPNRMILKLQSPVFSTVSGRGLELLSIASGGSNSTDWKTQIDRTSAPLAVARADHRTLNIRIQHDQGWANGTANFVALFK